MVDTNIKGFLFDHDGIVIDIEQALVNMNTEILKPYNVKFDPDLRRHFSGKPEIPGLEVLIDVHGLKGKVTAQELSKVRMPMIHAWYAEVASHVPGFLEHYQKIREAFPNTPVAVASGSDQFYISDKIRGTSALFDGNICLTSELDLRHKPEPDVFVYAAGMLRVPPKYCAVWEDSPLGLAGSITAGVRKNIALTRTLPEDALIEATQREIGRELKEGEILFIDDYSPDSTQKTIDYLK